MSMNGMRTGVQGTLDGALEGKGRMRTTEKERSKGSRRHVCLSCGPLLGRVSQPLEKLISSPLRSALVAFD